MNDQAESPDEIEGPPDEPTVSTDPAEVVSHGPASARIQGCGCGFKFDIGGWPKPA